MSPNYYHFTYPLTHFKQPLYVGIAANLRGKDTLEIGTSIHDGVYSIDFCIHTLKLKPNESIAEIIKIDALDTIQKYSREHHAKFVACGITDALAGLCPNLGSFLWSELDIVVMKFKVKTEAPRYAFSDEADGVDPNETMLRDVDEQADSAVRKCLTNIGPGHTPCLSIGFRNRVEPDIGGKIQLVTHLDSYKNTVHEGTWKCVLHYANELKKNKIKIAFFSATPQGGGVALMRHALIRFYRLLGVNVQWFVESHPLYA